MGDSLTEETIVVRKPVLDRDHLVAWLDTLDDDERQNMLTEITETEHKVAELLLQQIDRQMEDLFIGRSLGLPSDPTYYTHDSSARVIDV